MAKKAATRKKAKPSMMDKKVGTTAGATQREFAIAQVANGPVSARSLVQVDKCLNLVNRRLYRQHKVYTAKIELSDPNEDQTPIDVYALRNTWAVRKAMALAKSIYDEAVAEERAVVGNARWHDFRINASASFDSLAVDILPFAVDGVNLEYKPLTLGSSSDGEYNVSAVEVTTNTGTTQSKTFGLRPSSIFQEYSIWAEYQKMGPTTSETPVFNSDGGYDRATGTSFEDENVQDLLNKGNLPPYDAGDLGLSSPWVKVGSIGRQTNGGMVTSTGFFEAPLGMIVLDGYTIQTTEDGGLPLSTKMLECEVKMGDYKGVMAHDI